MRLSTLKTRKQRLLSAALLSIMALAATLVVALPEPAAAGEACFGLYVTGCTTCQPGLATAKWCYVCDWAGHQPSCYLTNCHWQWLPC